MKPDDQLFDAVFADAASPAFREQVLANTLGSVRGRKRRRQAMSVTAIGAALVVAGLLLRWGFYPTIRPSSSEQHYALVRTNPAGSVVVASTVPGGVERVQTHNGVRIVHTQPGNLQFLNDKQLLALVPQVGLVRVGANPPELIFR